jgi:hypothetical protein
MRNPITYLSTATGSGKDDNKNIRAYKVWFTKFFLFTQFFFQNPLCERYVIRWFQVKKAVDFLSLPEIRNIDALSTKKKFLKTRGLNEDEIKEAFSQLEKVSSMWMLDESAKIIFSSFRSITSLQPLVLVYTKLPMMKFLIKAERHHLRCVETNRVHSGQYSLSVTKY